ncbi:MAG: TOBE domain-containing protein [Aerococcus sp.]|nr:TOBE domain-containing protein [Aerococcus sp.]
MVDTIAIRPEHLHRATAGESVLFEGKVVHLSHIAREREVHVELASGQIVRMVDLPVIDFTVGDQIPVAADPNSILWFDQNGERVIA